MKEVNCISVAELARMAERMSEPLVKAVVDSKRRILVVDVGLHADAELYLLKQGSDQCDVWGINLWPAQHDSPEFVEFDSMINIRPAQGNRCRGVEDVNTQKLIREIVAEKVHD